MTIPMIWGGSIQMTLARSIRRRNTHRIGIGEESGQSRALNLSSD